MEGVNKRQEMKHSTCLAGDIWKSISSLGRLFCLSLNIGSATLSDDVFLTCAYSQIH